MGEFFQGCVIFSDFFRMFFFSSIFGFAENPVGRCVLIFFFVFPWRSAHPHDLQTPKYSDDWRKLFCTGCRHTHWSKDVKFEA